MKIFASAVDGSTVYYPHKFITNAIKTEQVGAGTIF